MLNDVYRATGAKTVTLLAALDISAAFDIPMIMHRLEGSFGISGAGLEWIKSYFTNRTQFVKIGKARSPSEVYNFDPQIFTLYDAPIGNVITSFGVDFHQYADDTQLYLALDR